MAKWWHCLCRWARLHATKERLRNVLQYAYPRRRGERQCAPVEPMEPRMLFSASISDFRDGIPRVSSTKLDEGQIVVLDSEKAIRQTTLGDYASRVFDEPAKADLADTKGTFTKSAPGQTSAQGSTGDDLLFSFSADGELDGGAGNDTIAVLPSASKRAAEGIVDAGSGDDVIYVIDGSARVIGGAGYDILFSKNAQVKHTEVEEVWVYNPGSDLWFKEDLTRAVYESQTIDGMVFGTASAVGGAFHRGLAANVSSSGSSSAYLRTVLGDLTGSGTVELDDYVAWVNGTSAPNTPVQGTPEFAQYDLYPDGVLNVDDVTQLVEGYRGTKLGEQSFGNDASQIISQADLDKVLLNWGDTPSGDFILDYQEGQYYFDGLVSQNELDAVLLNFGFKSSDPVVSTAPNAGGQIYGFNAGDTLNGGTGSDFLWGGRGADVIDGGSGADILVGGTFDSSDDASVDIIKDPDLEEPLGLAIDEAIPGIVAHVTVGEAYVNQPVTLNLHFANPTDGALVQEWVIDWGVTGESPETYGGVEVLDSPPSKVYGTDGAYTIKVWAKTQLGERLGAWEVDTDFGTAGLTTVSIYNDGRDHKDQASSILVDAQGRILLAGKTFDEEDDPNEFDGAITRLTTAAALDTVFSGDGTDWKSNRADENFVGIATYESGGTGSNRIFGGLSFKPDASNDNTSKNQFAVVQYFNDGAYGGAANDGNVPGVAVEITDGPSPWYWSNNAQNTGDNINTVQGHIDDDDTANGGQELVDYNVLNGIRFTNIEGIAGSVLQPSDDRMVMTGVDGTYIVVAKFRLDYDHNISSELFKDTTFGEDIDGDLTKEGYTRYDVGVPLDDKSSAVLDSQGRIVVAGTSNGQPVLARFSADGTLDTTFSNGVVTGSPSSTISLGAINYGVAATDNQDGTGYILYSAEAVDERFTPQPYSQNSDHLIAVKYENGQWYYDNNYVLTAFTPRADDVLLAEVDFDNDTITGLQGQTGTVYGISRGYSSGDLTFAANTFNGLTDSVAVGEFTVDGSYFTLYGVNAVTTDVQDRIVVAAQQGTEWNVLRVDSSGTLDTTFNSTGYYETAFATDSAESAPHAIAITPSQRILVSGQDHNGEWALLTLFADGTPDRVAGDADGLTFLSHEGTARAIELREDGRVLVAGDVQTGVGHDTIDFGLVQLDAYNSLSLDVLEDLVREENRLVTDSDDYYGTVDTFTVPATPGAIRIDFAGLEFDRTAQPTATDTATFESTDINDAFELLVLDSDGRSILPPINRGSEALFNMTQGQIGDFATADGVVASDGVRVSDLAETEGTYSGTVWIDLAAAPNVDPGDTLKLAARLINNDSDDLTVVGPVNLNLGGLLGVPQGGFAVPAEAFSPALTALPTGVNTSDRARAGIDFSRLHDVGAAFELTFGTTTVGPDLDNPDRSRIEVRAKVRRIPDAANGGIQPRGELLLALPGLIDRATGDPSSAQLLTIDGRTPAGLLGLPGGTPYIRLTDFIDTENGFFVDDASAQDISLVFSFDSDGAPDDLANPGNRRFALDPILLGEINEAPQFTSDPYETNQGQAYPVTVFPDPEGPPENILEIVAGQPFIYTPSGVDPDNDRVYFGVVQGPAGINPNTTLKAVDSTGDGLSDRLEWTPDLNQQQQMHDVRLRVFDEYGHYNPANDQTIRINVIDGSTNRPPAFDTLPDLTAEVGVAYDYDSNAFDPDGDDLQYGGALGARPVDYQITLTDSMGFTVGDQLTELTFVNDPGAAGASSLFSRVRLFELGDTVEPLVMRFDQSRFATYGTEGSDATVQVLGEGSVVQLSGDASKAYSLPTPLTITDKTVLSFTFAAGLDGTGALPEGVAHGIGLTDQSGLAVADADEWFQVYGTDTPAGSGQFNTYDPAWSDTPDFGVDTASGLVLWTPPGEAADRFVEVRLTAEEVASEMLEADQRYLVYVEPDRVNHDPIIVSPFKKNAEVDVEYTYTVRALDYDRDDLTFEFVGAVPTGMTITKVPGTLDQAEITWTPQPGDEGKDFDITIAVYDGRGGMDDQADTITVSAEALGSISGYKWEDLNGDGNWDQSTEPGLPNVKIYLDLNNNLKLDANEPFQLTSTDNPLTLGDETGYYYFGDLLPGTYIVREVVPLGFNQTFPSVSGLSSNVISFFDESEFIGVPPITFNELVPPLLDGFQHETMEDYLDDPNGPGSLPLTNEYLGYVYDQDNDLEYGIDFAAHFVGQNIVGGDQRDAQGRYPWYVSGPPTAGQPLQLARLDSNSGASELPVMINDPSGDPNPILGSDYTNIELDPLNTSISDTWVNQGPIAIVFSEPVVGFGLVLNGLDDVGHTEIVAYDSFGNVLATQTNPQKNPSGGVFVGLRSEDGATAQIAGFLVHSVDLERWGFGIDDVYYATGSIPSLTPAHVVVLGAGQSATNKDFGNQEDPSLPSSSPAITSKEKTESLVNRPYRYDVDGFSYEGEKLTYRLTSSPEGMVIDPETGLIAWEPTRDELGPHSVVVEVQDESGRTASQDFTLTIKELNSFPSLTVEPLPAAKAYVSGDPAYTFSLDVTDANGDKLYFAVDDASAALGIGVDDNGSLTWDQPTTPAATATTYPITVTVTDGRGGRDQGTFFLTVQPNGEPRLVFDDADPIFLNEQWEYTVRAADPEDGATPVSGLTFDIDQASKDRGINIDASTGLITWTPTTQATAVVTVSVTDSANQTVSAPLTLPVNVRPSTNQAPGVLGTPTGPAVEGQPWSYTLVADDDDDHNVQIRLTSWPSWYTPVATTAINSIDLSGTPVNVDKGGEVFDFEFELRDDDNKDDDYGDEDDLVVPIVLPLGVIDNVAPVIAESPEPTRVALNEQVEYEFSVFDLDGDDLRFELVNPVPGTGAFYAGDADLTATPTPTPISGLSGASVSRDPSNPTRVKLAFVADREGDQQITFRVTDAFGNEAFRTILLNVVDTSDAPPELGINVPSTVFLGDTVTIRPERFDSEADTLTYALLDGTGRGVTEIGDSTWSQGDDPALDPLGGLVPTGMKIDPVTGWITWTPQPEQVNLDGSDPYRFTVEVRDARHVVTLGPAEIRVVERPVQVNEGSAPYLISGPTEVVSAIDEEVRLAFEAVDFGNDSGQVDYFFVEVAGVPAGSYTVEHALGTFPWEGHQYAPASMDTNNPSRFEIVFAANALVADDYLVQVIITEFNSFSETPESASSTVPLTIYNPVTPVNNLTPSGHVVGRIYTGVDELYAAQAYAEDADPADTITFKLLDAAGDRVNEITDEGATDPTGLRIDEVTGRITWTPTAADLTPVGDAPYTYTVVIDDDVITDGYHIIRDIPLTVVNNYVNLSPEIDPVPDDLTTTGSQPLVIPLNATDKDNDPLTWSLQEGPESVKIDTLSGELTWTPTADERNTTQSVLVRVEDGHPGNFDEVRIDLRSTANRGPRITSQPPQPGYEGETYTYLVEVDDEGPVTITASPLITGATFVQETANTGRFTWADPPPGPQSFTFTAVDEHGVIGSKTINLVIGTLGGGSTGGEFVDTPPEFLNEAPTSVWAEQLYVHQIQAFDPDVAETGPISYNFILQELDGTEISPPVDAVGDFSVNTSTGEISWLVPASEAGKTYLASVIADQHSYRSGYTFMLEIRDPADGLVDPTSGVLNGIPVLAEISNIFATVGTTFTINIPGQDPEQKPLEFFLIDAAGDPVNEVDGLRITPNGAVSWDVPLGIDLSGPEPVTRDFTVIARDPGGAESLPETYTITLQGDQPPVVSVQTQYFRPEPGQLVEFYVGVQDEGPIQSVSLTISPDNGDPDIMLSVGSNGRVAYRFDEGAAVGETFTVFATAQDLIHAPVSSESIKLTIASQSSPVVTLSTDLPVEPIRGPLSITGSIIDPDGDLVRYEVYALPKDGGAPINLIDPVEWDGTSYLPNIGTAGLQELAVLNPLSMPNGDYTIVVLASDDSDRPPQGRQFEVTVDTDTKLGEFNLTLTDLTVSVGGIPITVQRTYRSADRQTSGDFGYGWSLEILNGEMSVSGLGDNVIAGDPGYLEPYQLGVTRPTFTLPGGEQVGFTAVPLSYDKGGIVGGVLSLGVKYGLGFSPDASNLGYKLELSTDGTNSSFGGIESITIAGDVARQWGYFDPDGFQPYETVAIEIDSEGDTVYSGTPFNPASYNYRANYRLTAPDGTQYLFDPATNQLLSVTDTIGNTIDLNDPDRIISTPEKGEASRLTIERTNGRITEVRTPEGDSVLYQYDTNGDLIAVRDRSGRWTTMAYGETQYSDAFYSQVGNEGLLDHYLTSVTQHPDQSETTSYSDFTTAAPIGIPAMQIGFDRDGRLNKIVDALGDGNDVDFTYEFDLGSIDNTLSGFSAEQTTDPNDNKIEIVRNARGQTVRTIQEIDPPSTSGGPGGSYLISVFEYEGDDQTVVWTPFEHIESAINERYTVTPTEGGSAEQSVTDYDDLGRPETVTDALGNTTTFEDYDGFGNPRRITDAEGNVTLNSYNGTTGQLRRSTQINVSGPDTVSEYGYDASGNLDKVTQVDGDGRRIVVSSFAYDARGRLIETTGVDPDGAGGQDAVTRYFAYDPDGNQTHSWSVKDGITTVSVTAFDAEDRVRGSAQYTLDQAYYGSDEHREAVLNAASNNPANWSSPTSAFVWSTETTYDGLGRVASSIDRFGRVSTNRYDVRGNVVETRTATKTKAGADAFIVSRTYFDNLGRATATSESFLVDTNGNYLDPVSETIAPDTGFFRVTHTLYDNLGRVVETRRIAGVPIGLEDDTAGLARSTFAYDAANETYGGVAASVVELSSSETVYGSNGRVAYSVSQITGDNPDGVRTDYYYDPAGRQIGVLGPKVTLTDSTGTSAERRVLTVYHYDKAGRQLEVITGLAVESTTGPDPRPAFDDLFSEDLSTDQPTSGQYVLDLKANVEDPSRSVERRTGFEYDGLGRVTHTTQVGDLATGDITTQTIYDALGRRTAEIDGLNRRTDYEYDDAGRLTGVKLPEVDPTGVADGTPDLTRPVYEYGYDAYGNQDLIRDPADDSHIVATSGYDADPLADDKETTFTYDHRNRQISRTLPDDLTERMFYNDQNLSEVPAGTLGASAATGQLAFTLDFEGNITAYQYDNTATGGGRLVQKTYYDKVELAGLTSPPASITMAQIETELSNADAQRTVVYDYDAFGRQFETTIDRNLAGAADLHTTTHTYDDDGRVVRIDAPQGIINYAYDDLGRMTHTWTGVGTARGTGAGHSETGSPTTQTRYDHDELGRLTGVTLEWAEGQDITDQTTTYAYDATGAQDYEHNAATGVTKDAEYDALGRPDVLHHFRDTNANGVQEAGENTVAKFTYTYDAAGNRTSAAETFYTPETSLATVTLDNDDSGVNASAGWSSSTAVSTHLGTDYLHDGNTQDGTKFIVYTPDLPAAGTYEVWARWTADTNRASNTPYTIEHAGGTDTVRVDQRQQDGTWVLLGTYAFADNGSETVTISNDGTDGYVIADGVQFVPVESAKSQNFTWTYDGLNRLVVETFDSGEGGTTLDTDTPSDYVTRYTFDLASNRTLTEKATGTYLFDTGFTPTETVAYEYDVNDRLNTELKTVGAAQTFTEYEYDGTTQIGKVVYDGADDTAPVLETVTQAYDAMGRMESIAVDKDGTLTTTQYEYNDRGLRVKATETVDDGANPPTQKVTDYLFDTNNPTGYAQALEETVDGGGTPDKTFVLGHDVIAQVVAGGEMLALLYDIHGSTRALVNDAGAVAVNDKGTSTATDDVVQAFSYDAYGNLILTGFGATAQADALTSLLYSGEFTNAASGLQYLRARFYSASNGRFNRLDPYVGAYGDPLSLHRYSYVHGNPIVNIDPSGLSALADIQLAAFNLINLGIRSAQGVASAYRAGNAVLNSALLWLQLTRTGAAITYGLAGLNVGGFLFDEDYRHFVLAQPNLYGVVVGDAALLSNGFRNLGRSVSGLYQNVAVSRSASLKISDFRGYFNDLRAAYGQINSALAKGDAVSGLSRRTFAYLQGTFNGKPYFRAAHSGTKSLPGTAPVPTGPRYQTSRDPAGSSDAERKLIEELAAMMESNVGASGQLTLLIDHPNGAGACTGCAEVIRSFNQVYPNVQITTVPALP